MCPDSGDNLGPVRNSSSMRRILPVLLLPILLQGCASLISTIEEKPGNKVYAGTRFVAEVCNAPPSPARILCPLGLLDFPLTLTLDTVLLPYTVPDALIHQLCR